jgi:hypothetical protein
VGRWEENVRSVIRAGFGFGASRTLRRLSAERTVSSLSGDNMSENAHEAASALREPEDA